MTYNDFYKTLQGYVGWRTSSNRNYGGKTSHHRYKTTSSYYSDITCINGHNVILLQSYDTIVSYYDIDISTIFVLDNYSTTTTQHVYKFINHIKSIYGNNVYVVWLYKRYDNVVVLSPYGKTTLKELAEIAPEIIVDGNYNFDKIFKCWCDNII